MLDFSKYINDLFWGGYTVFFSMLCTSLVYSRSPITFPARPELCLDTISPCNSTTSHSGGLLPSGLPLQEQMHINSL